MAKFIVFFVIPHRMRSDLVTIRSTRLDNKHPICFQRLLAPLGLLVAGAWLSCADWTLNTLAEVVLELGALNAPSKPYSLHRLDGLKACRSKLSAPRDRSDCLLNKGNRMDISFLAIRFNLLRRDGGSSQRIFLTTRSRHYLLLNWNKMAIGVTRC